MTTKAASAFARTQTIANLAGWQRQGVAMLAGALTALALPPVYALPVCFITFPLLTFLLDGIHTRHDGQTAKRARLTFLTGWSFGFGYFVAGLWWIAHAMLIDPASYWWAIPLAVFGLPAVLAVYWGLATLLAFPLWQKGYGRLLALAFGFGVAEWLRGVLFTGFPWNAIGYTAMPIPLLMQPAAVFGLYGMNALAVLVFATPALAAGEHIRKTGFAITALLVAAALGFSLTRLPETMPAADANSLAVRLIQPSVPQDEKAGHETLRANFEHHLRLTSAAPHTARQAAAIPQLIIWPETSVPYPLETPGLLPQIAARLQHNQQALVGAIRMKRDNSRYHYFNSMQLIDHQGRIKASADKVHLVPFGEYMPFGTLFRRLGIQGIAEIAGGYSVGDKRRTITLSDGTVILPLICYEIIFPTGLDYEGPAPDMLVNISNDAWFGNTPGPRQHLLQAQLRAVEQGLPVLRATNNGISAVIDPYGRITAMLGYDQIDFIDAYVPAKIIPFWRGGVGTMQAFALFTILFAASAVLLFVPRIFFHHKQPIDNSGCLL